MIVYEANWSLANSGEQPNTATGDAVRDSLDVAALQSEDKNSYEMSFPEIGLKPDNVLVREFYPDSREVVDAGRTILDSDFGHRSPLR